jgi:Bifunctional DNA primase/polymerase, N-terminal
VNELAASARDYARQGWEVFPIAPRGKTPLTKRGLHDATSDEGLVAAWWEERPQANIGLNCGASGLLVVDVDGEEAARAWGEVCDLHGGLPMMKAVATTKVAATARGFHFYFVGQGPSSASRVAAGVDTRGLGGYTILPPSVHATGVRYRWLGAADPLPLPGWLGDALERPFGEPLVVGERRPLPRGLVCTWYGRTALAGLEEDMLAAREGWRNDTLNRLGYRAGRLAAAGELELGYAERTLVAAAISVGLPEDEALRTYRSGAQAGLLFPAARLAL